MTDPIISINQVIDEIKSCPDNLRVIWVNDGSIKEENVKLSSIKKIVEEFQLTEIKAHAMFDWGTYWLQFIHPITGEILAISNGKCHPN